jgi:hypothetical protein
LVHQFIEGAIHLSLRVTVGFRDLEVLILDLHMLAAGIEKAENAGHNGLFHDLTLVEDVSVSLTDLARGDDEPR